MYSLEHPRTPLGPLEHPPKENYKAPEGYRAHLQAELGRDPAGHIEACCKPQLANSGVWTSLPYCDHKVLCARTGSVHDPKGRHSQSFWDTTLLRRTVIRMVLLGFCISEYEMLYVFLWLITIKRGEDLKVSNAWNVIWYCKRIQCRDTLVLCCSDHYIVPITLQY